MVLIIMETIGNKDNHSMYSLSSKRLSWWSMNSAPQDSYSFSRADASLLINLDVIFHIVLVWPLSVFITYACVFYREVYLQIFPVALVVFLIILVLIILCVSCVSMGCRWLLFKYSETVSLSIDVKRQTFIYKQDSKIIEFCSGDIDNWYSAEYKADPYNVCAEIVEIKLKTGERIIVSNGIGPVVDFFREKWKELGMPEGKRSSKALISYVKEMKNW